MVQSYDSSAVPKEIGCDDFARRFSLRKANLMWFLGAGTSASAGIPTALDMVWDFKRELFVSQRRVSRESVADLSSPFVRDRIQSHIDSLSNLPAQGTEDEYATLFETVYPSESDRRMYIDASISGAKPSYGHIALAAFMHAGMARLVWTTNFDSLVDDACAKVFEGTGALTTGTLDSPEVATVAIKEGRWPVQAKLHGDFRSRRLKNTPEELRHQDASMRRALIEACSQNGLVICGYSGRDDSIMKALEESAENPEHFPSGLFWLYRGSLPGTRVKRLLLRVASRGIDAFLVRIDNFDEVMRDLVRICPDLKSSELDAFGTERKRVSAATMPTGKLGWPVVRLNAIKIMKMPTVCRKVVCKIGGIKEVQEAIRIANVDLIATRVQAGVLLFGSDDNARAAFDRYDITDFDIHPIEQRRLRFDSGERGLLREAISKALAHNRQLTLIRRRSSDLLYPLRPADDDWKELKSIVGSVYGAVEKTSLHWFEGIGVSLGWADEQLWLLIEPRIVFEGIDNENKKVAADFAREKTVRRYNKTLNELIDYWSNLLSGDEETLGALGIADGVDAKFAFSTTNAFSRRIGV